MERISLFVSPELLKAAQDLNSSNLKVPDDAVIAKGDKKRWPEKLTVTKSSVEKLEGTDRYSFRIGFKVAADSPTVVNRGRNTTGSYLYNPKATSDDHPDSFMTRITLARLDSFLRAVGYELPTDERADFGAIFSDPECPFIGIEVNATLVDRPDDKDPEKKRRRQDIGSFTKPEA